MKRLLFHPDPAPGGNPTPPEQNAPPPPPDPPKPGLADPPKPGLTDPPKPPPAANDVINGDRTERELKLEEDLRKANERAEKAEGTIKQREVQNAELQDKLDRFTTETPKPKREKPLRIRRIKL